MALRLGEVLIQNRIIDEQQLNAALDAQLIYGGHLGTCLVELGFVNVDTLAEVLSKQFSVDPAERERILKIDPLVIGTLSQSLVIKHEVVPFELKDRVLHVAMINPKNLLALDELSFASGYKIEAWVAPEILIHRAMEHYYRVPRKLRHISVSGARLKSQAEAAEAAPSEPPTKKPPTEEPQTVAAPETQQPQAAAPPAPEPPLEPPPQQPPNDDLPETEVSEPDSSTADEGFVAQTRPRVHTEQMRGDDADPGQSHGGKLAVDWIKRRHGEGQHWCDLYRVPVSHEHFNEVAGVYVVWHNGHNPVLRVGQGYIRTELSTLKLDPRIRSIASDSPVFASWAQVQRGLRDGVERYLIEMLGPQIVTDKPDVEPIEVNLPC